jgi:hypothetical protein
VLVGYYFDRSNAKTKSLEKETSATGDNAFADTGDNSTAHKNNLHIDVWLVGCLLVEGGY